MKKYTNLILLSLLVVLFYKTPEFLADSVSTSMGKLSWMIVIGVMYKMVDPISAIILAVIMITLLHQSTVEGYSNKKSEEEKTDQEKIAEMEKEMDEKEKKEKMKNKEEMENKELTKRDMEKLKMEEEEELEKGKEGFSVIHRTRKQCQRYNKEGFTGFTELLKKLKIPVTNTNTTDLDRDIKTYAERSTLDSTQEHA
jgi:predicted membrane protein